MLNPTPSAPAPTSETPADRFRRLVAGIAATLDETFPSVIITDRGAGSIDDDSAFYGADSVRPDFVARDDAAWKG